MFFLQKFAELIHFLGVPKASTFICDFLNGNLNVLYLLNVLKGGIFNILGSLVLKLS